MSLHPASSELAIWQEARRSPIGWRDRLIALLLFALCVVAYHRAPAHQVYDWRYVTAVSHSLLHRGSLEVPRSLAAVSRYQLQLYDGRAFHLFPAAPAVLNVPLVWWFERRGVAVFRDDGSFDSGAERRVLRAGAALVTAGTVALLYLVARLFTSSGWALPLSLVFAFGTSLYSSASRPYWSHAWAVFLLALGMLCLLAPSSRRWLRDAAGATALSWAFFCRPPLALSVAALTLFVTLTGRRRLATLAVVGGGWAVAFVAYSLSIYGQPLPPYFGSLHSSIGTLDAGRLLGFHPEAAAGTLFSPARGLFFYTPFLLVLLTAVVRFWRSFDRPLRWLAGLGLAVLVAHWHLVSSFSTWGGGASFGPRLLTDVLPWFLVLGALAAHALERPAGGSRRRLWVWAVAAALLAVPSVWIHHRGAVERLTLRHHGVWNWRYPPFLFNVVWNPVEPLPGARVSWIAGADRRPEDGWHNTAGRPEFALRMAEGIGYRRLAAPGGASRGAFVFRGAGGGTTSTLQNLGGEPNVTESSATFEVWLRPAAAGARRQVVFETGGRATGVTLFLEAGRPGIEVRDGGAASSVELVSPEPVSRGELSQVAAVLERLDEGFELTVWINGRRVAGPLPAPGIRDWAGGSGSGLATAANESSLEAGDFHGEIALFRYYPVPFDAEGLRHNLEVPAG